jgi:hypothetical protein
MWHKSKYDAETENNKPAVAATSAYHASRVDVIKDHGYIWAAICKESDACLRWSLDWWFRCLVYPCQ